MSQYASLYGYSRLLQNVSTPLLTKKMHTSLKTMIFPHISIKTYNSDRCDGWFQWVDGTIDHKRRSNFTQSNNSIQTEEKDDR